MAKAKKVNLIKSNLRVKKIRKGHFKAKNNNFDCFVKLENIDNLLRKYGISNVVRKDTFNIAIQINSNKLTVSGQQLSIQKSENQFHLNFQIKNNALTIGAIDERAIDKTVQSKHNELQVRLSRPQRSVMPVAQNKKIQQIVEKPGKLPRSKTIAELANDAWKRCKYSKSKDITFEVDQFVIGKMKSFPPWPCKIVGFTKNRKKVHVYFYGTHNSGSIEVNEITLFENSDEVIHLLLLRHLQCFAKGIREVEVELGIPAELSIINRHVLEDK